jgi:hypothetical protein
VQEANTTLNAADGFEDWYASIFDGPITDLAAKSDIVMEPSMNASMFDIAGGVPTTDSAKRDTFAEGNTTVVIPNPNPNPNPNADPSPNSSHSPDPDSNPNPNPKVIDDGCKENGDRGSEIMPFQLDQDQDQDQDQDYDIDTSPTTPSASTTERQVTRSQ